MTERPLVFKKITQIKVGDMFGRPTVVEELAERSKHGDRILHCKCECGNYRKVLRGNLKNGNSTSCGCYGREKKTKPPGIRSWVRLYDRCRNNANQRNITFSINFDQFINMATQDCKYCGSAPKRYSAYVKANGIDLCDGNSVIQATIDRSWIFANGIDRVNSDIGYRLDNCVPCCSICNAAKTDMTLVEFELWLDNMVKFRSK
jgi:hypothetical protein